MYTEIEISKYIAAYCELKIHVLAPNKVSFCLCSSDNSYPPCN